MTDLLIKHASLPDVPMEDLTVLPWDLPLVPKYPLEHHPRDRHVFKCANVELATGYFRAAYKPKEPIWLFCRNNEPVRKLDPARLESYMPHIAAAKGHVVLDGFGMGVMMFNLLLKPEVTGITLFDTDKRTFMRQMKLMGCAEWPNIHKYKGGYIGEAGMFGGACPEGQVDHLFIEGDVPSMETVLKATKMATKLGPKQTSWLGMEIDYIDWLDQHYRNNGRGQRPDAADADFADNLRQWAEAAAKYNVHVDAIIAQPEWPRLAYKAVGHATNR